MMSLSKYIKIIDVHSRESQQTAAQAENLSCTVWVGGQVGRKKPAGITTGYKGGGGCIINKDMAFESWRNNDRDRILFISVNIKCC
jgi:hypothetical protein